VDGAGSLFVVSPDGALIWELSLGAPPAASPILDLESTVYVATNDGRLHSVVEDKTITGTVRWTAKLPASVALRPMLAPAGVLYAALSNETLAAVGRPLTGHDGVCNHWSLSSSVCQEVCSACRTEFNRCYGDPACESIAHCVLDTGCSTATGCALPATCRAAIDSAGGIGGESVRRASALGRCATQACFGGAR
jgi:hypothetical protein